MRTSRIVYTGALLIVALLEFFQPVSSYWVNREGYLFDEAYIDIAIGRQGTQDAEALDIILLPLRSYTLHYVLSVHKYGQDYGPRLKTMYSLFRTTNAAESVDSEAYSLEFKDPGNPQLLFVNPEYYEIDLKKKERLSRAGPISPEQCMDFIADANAREVDLVIKALAPPQESSYRPAIRPILGRITHITLGGAPVFIANVPKFGNIPGDYGIEVWRLWNNLEEEYSKLKRLLEKIHPPSDFSKSGLRTVEEWYSSNSEQSFRKRKRSDEPAE